MPPKLKVDVKKLEAERLTGFLLEMLREEENKYCADCEAKQPRWASWNLGVFLCIRCAGLHRNLGVHISKVKSVNLDSWTAEQVQSVRVMGNAKAKAVYEADLPELFRRPQSDQSLEAFIRAKYEAKRYILKDWQPPAVNVADLPSLAGPVSEKKSFHLDKFKTNSQKSLTTIGPLFEQKAVASEPVANLIDIVFDSPPCAANNSSSNQESFSTTSSVPATQQSNVPNLLDIVFDSPYSNTSTNNQTTITDSFQSTSVNNSSLDDLFGPIVSAPNPIANNAPSLHQQNSTTATADCKKSNTDILALFANIRAPAPTTSTTIPPQKSTFQLNQFNF